MAFILLLTVPGVSTWAQPPAPGPGATAAAMHAEWDVFAKHGCARCHRVRGMGDGAVGPDLGRLGRGTGFFEIAAAMWNHGTQMGEAMKAAGVGPAPFAGAELPDIMAYVLAAGRDPRGEVAPTVFGVAERGTRLFAEKRCGSCHAVGGKSSPSGPSLGPHTPRATATELAGRLWNHGPAVPAHMTRLGIGVPRLAGQEMADITAYLHAAPTEARRGRYPLRYLLHLASLV